MNETPFYKFRLKLVLGQIRSATGLPQETLEVGPVVLPCHIELLRLCSNYVVILGKLGASDQTQ